MTVKAIDNDDNENGRVTYHFQIDDHYVQETMEFMINENTGELRIKQNLDREFQPRYQVSIFSFNFVIFLLKCFLQLVLVARDHGSPKWLKTTTNLRISLVDENDNKPEFPQTNSTKPYHFYLNENNVRGQLIGKCFIL